MAENPKISMCASAHKIHYWKNFYNSIGNNDVSFEIIFVGPDDPDFKLPDNFRFIKSFVKPTQCYEIAIRNATGDLIIPVADDIVFRTERPLDKLYSTYKNYNDDKLILSCRYMERGNLLPPSAHIYGGVIMPFAGLMSKKLYKEIGGIDRNFKSSFWDIDIALRICAAGGRVILSDVCLDEHCGQGGSCNPDDRSYLDALWITNNAVHFNRKAPFEPFSDNGILEKSQGPSGRWI